MTTEYIINQIAILSIFGIVYQLVYRRNTHFLLNRIVLLSALLIAILVPLLNFNIFPYEVIVKDQTVELIRGREVASSPIAASTASLPPLTIIYLLGLLIALVIFVRHLLSILFTIKKSRFDLTDGHFVTSSPNKSSFSFFNFIFLANQNDVVLSHEIGHARLGHSYDRLICGLLTCIFWFNPLVHLFRYWLVENHEFAADRFAMDKLQIGEYKYGKKLLNMAVGMQMQAQIANQFHSLTKNRISILKKSKRSNSKHYICLLPLLFIVFSAFTFKSYPVYKQSSFSVTVDTIPQNNQYGFAYTIDSLPGQINQLDTSIIFDYATGEEEFKTSKLSTLGKPFVPTKPLSGRKKTSIDTLVIFNPENFLEVVQVIKHTLPEEIFDIYQQLSQGERRSVDLQYAQKQTLSIKYPEKDLEAKLYFEKGHSGFKFDIKDRYGAIVKALEVKSGKEMNLGELRLPPGKYTGVRSDNDFPIVIEVF